MITPLKAYAIVDKNKPKINLNDIYKNKKDAILLSTEKWIEIIIYEPATIHSSTTGRIHKKHSNLKSKKR